MNDFFYVIAGEKGMNIEDPHPEVVAATGKVDNFLISLRVSSRWQYTVNTEPTHFQMTNFSFHLSSPEKKKYNTHKKTSFQENVTMIFRSPVSH